MTVGNHPVADVAGVLVQHRQRVREIADVMARYGFTRLARRAAEAEEPDEVRSRRWLSPVTIEPAVTGMTTGERLRGALGELGTTWIKLGQMLSVRPDVVGQDVADELAKLQADVPADPPPYAENLIAHELGQPVSELFASFEPTAMASGSVAQVHRATLLDGSPAAVKVLHDGVTRKVISDLELMEALAAFVESVDEDLARFRPAQLIAEFGATIRAAVDLTRELSNLRRFTANFAAEPDVIIPGHHAGLSGTAVLTMDLMSGDRLSTETVKNMGWEVEELVDRTTKIYLDMVFRHGAFHADPHPGNFLLRPGKEIVILDFGDVGFLSAKRRGELEGLLVSMTTKDLDEMTSAIATITDADPATDRDELAADVDQWSAEYLQGDLSDLDISGLLTSMMRLMNKHRLSLPSDLADLFRVLLLLQGMATKLGSSSNLNALLEPYVQEMAQNRRDPRVLGKRFLKQTQSWNDLLGTLPADVRTLLDAVKDGQVDIDLRLHDPEGQVDRVVDGLLVSALVVAASQLTSRRTGPTVGSASIPGLIAAGLGILSYRRLRVKRPDHVTAADRVSRVLKVAKKHHSTT